MIPDVEIICRVAMRGENGNKFTHQGPLTVKNHWNNSKLVQLICGNDSFFVSAKTLQDAIQKCSQNLG